MIVAPAADSRTKDLAQKLYIASGRVLGREFDLVSKLAGAADGRIGHFKDLCTRLFQLIFKVDVGGGHKRMNARVARGAQRGGGAKNVLFNGPAECRHRGIFAHIRHGLYRLKIPFGRDGKTRLDNVDTKSFQLPGHAYLFLKMHRAPRRLLAVTQRSIKDLYLLRFHLSPRFYRSDPENLPYSARI